MYVKVLNINNGDAGAVVTTCPVCGNGGTFDRVNVPDLMLAEAGHITYWLGHRKCPNQDCNAHIFFRRNQQGELTTNPSLRINFVTDNIPEQIRSSLEQSITCHSEGCYVAAAIMVRRTLEELCDDKASKGDNLKKRIENLQGNVLLPKELFEAMDELRLLGNDAAHIESKDYDNIGSDEVEIAIELTKEILKGVYQMDTLLSKLKGLKKA